MDEDSVSKAGQEEQEPWRELLDDLELEKTSSPKTFLDLDYDPFEEKRDFTFQSLDDALQAIIECVAEERGSQEDRCGGGLGGRHVWQVRHVQEAGQRVCLHHAADQNLRDAAPRFPARGRVS